MDGDLSFLFTPAQLLVDSNSIHHSYNKCITVHSTQGVSLTNNVCARVVGHIFYEEMGDEQNITSTHNLGLGAMSNNFDINDGTDLSREELIKKYWWTGDKMIAAGLTYDGFNIPGHWESDERDARPLLPVELTRPFGHTYTTGLSDRNELQACALADSSLRSNHHLQ